MAQRYQGGILGVGFNPLQAPNAPTIGTATKGNALASVTFTAPANVGGSAITSYAAQSNPGAIGATGSASPITVSGLTNDTAYTFQVTALNSYGPSPASGASNSVTPTAPTGWIGVLTSGQYEEPNGIALDNDNNIYINGYTTNPSNPYGFAIIKLSNLGVIQFQKKLDSSFNSFGSDVTLDNINNSLYVTGYSSLGGGTRSAVLAKYNLTGTLQWQRALSPGNGDIYTYKVTTDSSGDVYFSGQGRWTGNSSFDCGYYAKYNSSGTSQVVMAVKPYSEFTTRSDNTQSVKIDSSGNIYVCGGCSDYSNSRYPATQSKIFIAKYDSANNFLWLQKLAGIDDSASSMAINNSGDIYVAAQKSSGGVTQCLLLKYNASGVIQWQRQLGDPAKSGGWQQIAIDGSGNIYCAGYSYELVTTGDYEAVLAKYNSSGTLQWQRRLGSSSGNNFAKGLTVGNDGHLYVTSTIPDNAGDILIAKLPTDGGGTGTYSVNGASITYAATSLTDSTTTYTHVENYGMAGGNLSYGPTTPTLTGSNLTLTSTTTGLS